MPCVGLFTLLSVVRSYVVAHVLFWDDGYGLSLRSCPLAPWLILPRVRALPRSPGNRSCRGVLEPASPRSLLTHACLVYCAAGQSALLVLFVIMLALTRASSTLAPCPRALFETLVTSRRRVLERRRREALPCTGVFLFVVFTRGPPAPLCTRSGSRSVQSSFGNTSSPGESTVYRFHDISVWHLHVRDHTLAIHSALISFTLQLCSCRHMTISDGYVCDRRLQVQ